LVQGKFVDLDTYIVFFWGFLGSFCGLKREEEEYQNRVSRTDNLGVVKRKTKDDIYFSLLAWYILAFTRIITIRTSIARSNIGETIEALGRFVTFAVLLHR